MIQITAPKALDYLNKSMRQYSVEVPPSKYLANRLLILAAVAKGESYLTGIPNNADMDSAIEGLRVLSAEITVSKQSKQLQNVHIKGFAAKPSLTQKRLYTGDNGTFTRLITPWAFLCNGEVLIEGSAQMNARPMRPLLQALKTLGGDFQFFNKQWHLPFVTVGKLIGGACSLQGSESSQYFSSLLLIGSQLEKGLEISANGAIASKSYIEMTTSLMKQYGMPVTHSVKNNLPTFKVESATAKVPLKGFKATVAADASAATYFLAMGALGLGKVHLTNFNPNQYKGTQGEAQFAYLLQKMGATIEYPSSGGISIYATGKLKGISINMNDMPDAVPTLAVVAAAQGITNITGIGHLRHKESNRMEGLAGQLQLAGVQIEVFDDAIKITGGNLKPATLNSLADHRLAMSFSLISLLCKNVTIKNEDSVEKTFPHYFEVLKNLGFNCKK